MTSLANLWKQKREFWRWFGFFMFMLVVFWVFLWGDVLDWFEYRQDLKAWQEQIPIKEKLLAEAKNEHAELKQRFEREAYDIIEKEKTLLPESIDINQMARTIEMFSLLLDKTDVQRPYDFTLQSLSFGTPRSDKAPYSKTPLNISFEADEQSFRDFIRFLEKGTIPTRFEQAKLQDQNRQNSTENDSVSLLTFDYISEAFVKSHPLPLINVQSLNLSAGKSKDSRYPLFTVNVQANIFSQ